MERLQLIELEADAYDYLQNAGDCGGLNEWPAVVVATNASAGIPSQECLSNDWKPAWGTEPGFRLPQLIAIRRP